MIKFQIIIKLILLSFICFMLSQVSFAQELQLDKKLRKETVNQIAQMLIEKYAMPEIGNEYAEHINKKLVRGEYNSIQNPHKFAEKVTSDLKEVKDDKHLRIRYSPQTVINIRNSEIESIEERKTKKERQIANEQSRNYGFKELKILSGNTGYLRFDEFPSERGSETIIAAMGFLKYSDAIIIDLRNNTGGNPEIVAFIGGYFFTEDYPTEFSSLFHRIKNETFQYKTPLYLPGKRLAHTDLYILVGSNTFSAAECFAYDLQHYGRAIIVGTKTKGGAHVANPFIVNDDFVVDIPFSIPINPITNSNWEETGVEPDIKCEANDALQTAHRNILNKLIENNSDRYFLNSLGYSLIRENNIHLAIDVFKKNIEIHPNYANGYDSLGEAYMKTGKNELAVKNYERSLELDPGNDNAKAMLKQLKGEK